MAETIKGAVVFTSIGPHIPEVLLRAVGHFRDVMIPFGAITHPDLMLRPLLSLADHQG